MLGVLLEDKNVIGWPGVDFAGAVTEAFSLLGTQFTLDGTLDQPIAGEQMKKNGKISGLFARFVNEYNITTRGGGGGEKNKMADAIVSMMILMAVWRVAGQLSCSHSF